MCKNKKNIKLIWALSTMIILISVIDSSNVSAQSFYMRICGKWRSQYTDSGMGETMFSSSSVQNRNAPFAYYRLERITGGWVTISEGYLDSEGCSGYAIVENNKTYAVSIGTKFVKTGPVIAYVQPIQTSATPVYSDTYRLFTEYYTPSGNSQGAYTTHNAVINEGFYSNMGPIVGRMLSITSTLDITSNTTFHMVGCTTGSAFSGDNNTYYMYIPGSTDHSREKFRVAHEIGHAIGDLGNPRIRWGDNLTHSSQFCLCMNGGTRCLQSWESIRLAQTEGFAHFISTVLYNSRNSNGYFGSYRNTRFPNATNPSDIWSMPFCDQPTLICTAPWSVNTNYNIRWMENNCSTDMVNKGVEWDWLNFFWTTWSVGADRINIAEIRAIWPVDGSPVEDYNWTNSNPSNFSIRNSAETYLNMQGRQNFLNRAASAGVDHGHNG